MESVNQILLQTPTSLPLGPGYEVCGVNVRGCSYFNSYTLPLKVAFLGPDRGILPAIFKVWRNYNSNFWKTIMTLFFVLLCFYSVVMIYNKICLQFS